METTAANTIIFNGCIDPVFVEFIDKLDTSIHCTIRRELPHMHYNIIELLYGYCARLKIDEYLFGIVHCNYANSYCNGMV